MIQNMDELVTSAVCEVFETMLNMRMASASTDLVSSTNGQQHVAGAVGFIGRLTGVVYIHAAESFARRITMQLLGLSEADIQGPEMVNDTMGELANMIVGHMKSRLSDRGMPCVLTIPSVVRGSHVSIEPVTSTTSKMFVFSCNGSLLFVQFLIKPTQPTE